ncbi:MBL fold metallo-hydrolase [Gammaproteobacteria bacterium]|jgi:N-acyl-phosphatidylethanolamine-hydrolysing phospholipase D|nr:MBL fold metallo-hydrolase [Gammaproteobacteria bacterium]MDC3302387.1 MBL fold metallo-hydrolase [Gammaproteobacteria bacterium]
MLKILISSFIIFTSFNLSADFKNTNGKALEKSLGQMLEWMGSDIEPQITKIKLSDQWETIDLLNDDNYVIWVGHSTFLIKKSGVTILTDPIFSERASPLKNFGPKRLIPPALQITDIPSIDFVTVSHNHYDHLDTRSLKEISTLHPNAIFLVPSGDLKLLKKNKINNVYEFEWWKSFKGKNFEFTFTPVQHWSKRSLFDRNKSLWGGWYIKHSDYSIYHAGDTGYSDDFKETRIRLGAPKYAFIPIGAYDPEWFMSDSHVNPEEAVQIMLDLQAEKGFGMHWATFTLTDEDTIEPKIRLENATSNLNNLDFISLVPGDVIDLD